MPQFFEQSLFLFFLKLYFSQAATAVFLVVVFRGVTAEGEEGGKGKYKVLTQEEDDEDEMEKESQALSSMVNVDLGGEEEEDEEELL